MPLLVECRSAYHGSSAYGGLALSVCLSGWAGWRCFWLRDQAGLNDERGRTPQVAQPN